MNRLLRYYGIKKLVFVLASLPCCKLACWVLSGRPPVGFDSWVPEARAAVGLVCSGSHSLVAFLWVLLLVMPFRHSKNWYVIGVPLAVIAIAGIFWGIPGIAMLSGGVGKWIKAGKAYNHDICLILFWVVVLPVSFGAIVAFVPDIIEQVRSNDTFRRLFISGQGHAAGWISPVRMQKFIKPLPQTPPENGGHQSSMLHLGQTLYESNYSVGQDVWLNEDSHFISCARTGSGKFITSIANILAMYQGSGVFVSIKPELADFGAGRRVDQTLFENNSSRSCQSLGVDTRGITQVKHMIPGSRSFVLDPTNQSVWNASCHNILSEIDVRDDSAPALINAIATASFPDQLNQQDSFWTLAPKGLFSGSIGHILTACKNPNLRNLSYCSDYCMGIDPKTKRADPDLFQQNLISMMRNPSMGGFIQRSASSIFQLGEKAFGSVNAEFENNTRWLSDLRIRRHLSGVSDFSYRELGDDLNSVSVFLVPPRSGADLQALLPWLRTHIELSLAVLEMKKKRPTTPILYLCDEFRQYGSKISAIRNGATTLREAGVKLALYVQSWPSLIDTLGEQSANELEACSAMEFFGTDQYTAEKMSRMLGKHTLRQKQGILQRGTTEKIVDVATPAEIMCELRKGSTLKYVFPATSAPMRIRRVAYKPITTEEGTHYNGLPLDGHYDDHLSQYIYNRETSS